MEVSGCDGVMIGRGGLGNPWIYKSIEASLNNEGLPSKPTLQDKKNAALKHLDLEIKTDGEKIGVLKFRRIACWYFKDVPGVAHFRAKINTLDTPAAMRDEILHFNEIS